MKITKFGHCCLRIDLPGAVILTDPGSFTPDVDSGTDIDAIIISHEHGDHMHVPAIHAVLEKNPGARVIANSAVAALLKEEGVSCEIVEGVAKIDINGVEIEAFDAKHEEIFEEVGQVQNTGYFVGNTLFYPGDAFAAPEDRDIPILALPVAGPWCRIPDALHYALHVNPRSAFPVHDGMIKEGFDSFLQHLVQGILKENGVDFIPLAAGESHEWE